MEKMKALFEKYGPTAVALYFVIFGLVFAGFIVAIKNGFAPEGVAGNTGVVAAAYVATKLTQPIRIGVTLVLTPVVSRIVDAVRGRKPDDAPKP